MVEQRTWEMVVTDLPGKCYRRCAQCGYLVQVYPVDAALSVWPDGMVLCRACADGPHEDDDREEE